MRTRQILCAAMLCGLIGLSVSCGGGNPPPKKPTGAGGHAGPNSPIVIAGGSLKILLAKPSGLTWKGSGMLYQTSGKVDLSYLEFGSTDNNTHVPYQMSANDTIVINATDAAGALTTITLTAVPDGNNVDLTVQSQTPPTVKAHKTVLAFDGYKLVSATVSIAAFKYSDTDSCDDDHRPGCVLDIGGD